MTPTRLLFRNLLYHWRSNLAVLLGVVVGTAVLTGALLIGDSQRGSLRDLAMRRLNFVDHAMITPRFFRAALADDLRRSEAAQRVAGVLLLQGTVSTGPELTPRTARKVTVLGVDGQFFRGEAPPPEFRPTPGASAPGSPDPKVAYLSPNLAAALRVQDGDEVRLHLQKGSDAPRETLLGKRDPRSVESTVKLTARLLPADSPAADFSLTPNPEAPRNALVPLPVLQKELALIDRANALLLGRSAPDATQKLKQALTLDDWDLDVVAPHRPSGSRTVQPDYLNLESPRLILEPAVVKAVHETDLTAAPTLVYMVNNIAAKDGSHVPYAVVAAVDLAAPGRVEKELRKHIPKLADDEIILAAWEEMPLKAKKGDEVTLTYFKTLEGGEFKEESRTFRVAEVVPLEERGLLADANLTQQIAGITDARDYSRLDVPFPFDNKKIRSIDELFWGAFRTTPQAYVNLKTGQELWGTRFGNVTTFRIVPPEGEDPAKAAGDALLPKLDPKAGGFVLRPVREDALRASSGGTDFAMLFLGFSFFLILSALLLVSLLVRLGLDRRAEEVGVLVASGLRLATIRRLLLVEGTVLAVVGSALGLGAAVLYAGVLIDRIREWWPGGLDASALQLHVTPMSLGIGFISAVLVSVLTIALSVRALGKVSPRGLIQGQTGDEGSPLEPGRPRRSRWVAVVALIGAVGCLVGGNFVEGHEARAGTFFGSGMLLLIAGLAFLRARMLGSRRQAVSGGTAAVARLGVRNASRHPSRSLLTAGLLGAAAFLLVGVESFRREPGKDYLRRDGGSGGFALLAESDVPIYPDRDLNSEAGRVEILDNLETRWNREPNMTPEKVQARREQAEKLLKETLTVHFRVRAGDDASCLNLYQPHRPRILGVPDHLIDEGGFAFSKTIRDADNPWQILRDTGGPIPVFGEQNTVVWMLKGSLGSEMELSDREGDPVKVKIAGLLHDSVFQSSLLMSERNFKNLYPDEDGYRFFLIRVDPQREDEVRELLETGLLSRGFAVTPTEARLAAFLAVENMYLSTFQALGGMGLLLGTLGLAVVLLRSVWERRGELALLRALGYRRATLGWLVLAENGFLLLLGLGLGTVTALVSVAPQVLTSGSEVNWGSLFGMLGLSLLIGLTASTIATAATARAALIPALRRE